MSHAAPRRHFPDKQALLSALVEAGYERLGARVDGTMKDGTGTFTERLTTFALVYVDFAVRNGPLMELMLASKYWPDSEHLARANLRAFAAPIALLQQAEERGDITPGPNDTAILAVLQGLTVMAHHGLTGPHPISEAVTDTITTLVEGLRPRL